MIQLIPFAVVLAFVAMIIFAADLLSNWNLRSRADIAASLVAFVTCVGLIVILTIYH